MNSMKWEVLNSLNDIPHGEKLRFNSSTSRVRLVGINRLARREPVLVLNYDELPKHMHYCMIVRLSLNSQISTPMSTSMQHTRLLTEDQILIQLDQVFCSGN